MAESHTELRPPDPSRWVAPGLALLALLPVAYMAVRSGLALRNAAYWDEIETVLDFLLKVQACPTWQDVVSQLFSLGNEHRTVTSRLLFAVSYWLTGSVDFTVIGIIGNLCLVSGCGLLLATAGTPVRRLQLAVLLSGLLFQLQHFENFFWSGSSIDHFQIVALAIAAFVALDRPAGRGIFFAAAFAALATFTLAHGILIWPIGGLVLLAGRRWRHLAIWSGAAIFTLGLFFTGYGRNTGHAIGDFSAAGLGRVFRFWLESLGTPLALGNKLAAPWLGAALLVLVATQLRPKIIARERIALPLIAWCIGALLLIGLGRVDVVQGHVHSRYQVLGGLAWALALFVQLNVRPDPARPYRALLRATPVVLAFNVLANLTGAQDAESWIICRDNALENFVRHGRDGRGTFFLHPVPHYTDNVVQRTERAGFFFMPRPCQARSIPDARPSDRLLYFVDRIPLTDTVVAIEGWAAVRQEAARPGEIHIVLQSQKSRHIFTALPRERPDVSAAHPTEQWRHAGFRFEIRRWLLPAEDFQIGILRQTKHGAEFVMTAHRINLIGEGKALLATGD